MLVVTIYIYLSFRNSTNYKHSNLDKYLKFFQETKLPKKKKSPLRYPNNYKERKTLESLASTKEVPASNQKHRTQSAMDVSSPALPVITDNFPVV